MQEEKRPVYGEWISLGPGMTIPYAWEDSDIDPRLLLVNVGDFRLEVPLEHSNYKAVNQVFRNCRYQPGET